jgi:hypothetical protein
MYAPSVSGSFRGFREMVSSGGFWACFCAFLSGGSRQTAIAAQTKSGSLGVEFPIKTII